MKKSIKRVKVGQFFPFFAAFVLLIITLANIDQLPYHLLVVIPRYDLFAHFIIYGLFCRLLDDFIQQKKFWFFGFAIPWAVIITLAFTLIEEFSQLILVNRTFSPMDFWFGVQGIYFFSRRYPERIWHRLRIYFRKKSLSKKKQTISDKILF